MKAERSCGNCHFYKGLEVTGECVAPIPDSVRFASFAKYRKLMFSTAGTECAAHRMKSVRKVAIAATKPE